MIGETEHGAVVPVIFEQVANVVVPPAFGTLWAYISRKGFSLLAGS